MKKRVFWFIIVLATALVVGQGARCFSTDTERAKDCDTEPKEEQQETYSVPEETEEPVVFQRKVYVQGALYSEAGPNDVLPTCGTMDGTLDLVVAEDELPNEEGEANFPGAEGYQNHSENSINVYIKEIGWIRFIKE